MKYLNAVAYCLLFSLFIMSCGDDPMEEEMEGLQGTWKATSFDIDVSSTASIFGFESTTTIVGSGSNLDYTLIFGASDFDVDGSYDFDAVVTSNGNTSDVSESYSNVMVDGTYSNTATEITLNEQIFDYNVEGFNVEETTGPVTATYEINGDVLTITQDETNVAEGDGFQTTTDIKSTSIWTRQ